MNIAFILPSLAQKGPILVAFDLVRNLLKNSQIKKIDVYYFDDIKDVNFPCETFKLNLSDSFDFDKYDIIHSHMLRPDLYIFKNKILRKIKKAKTISTIHQYNYENLKYDFNSKLKAYIISKLWEILWIDKDYLVTLSKDMTSYYKKSLTLKNKKISHIYNGRDFHTQNKKLNRKITINLGSTCLLTKRKGLEQVINALPLLPNTNYHIAGNGPELQNLRELSIKNNVEDRVYFHGFIKNINEFLTEIDVFLIPSRSEGFPLSLIEAASWGIPTVASNINVFKEAFSEKEIKFFELDNLTSLVDSINFSINNFEYLSENIKYKYERCFTAEKMTENYFNLYKSLSA